MKHAVEQGKYFVSISEKHDDSFRWVCSARDVDNHYKFHECYVNGLHIGDIAVNPGRMDFVREITVGDAHEE